MKKYRCVKLKEVRLERKLTQKQLANLIEIPVYRLQQLEQCLISPTLEQLVSLQDILNVSVYYLLGTSSIKDIDCYNDEFWQPNIFTVVFD